MSDRPEIPTSWLGLTLGNVIDYGKTVKSEPTEIPEDAWVLELEDIEKDTSQLLQRLTFAERLSKSTKNRFAAGDVLYGKLRPYLNKVLIADQDGYCTTEIIPIKPNRAIDGRYLFYWFKHPEFLGYVDSVSHGIQMPRLGTEAGLKAPLMLAPLNEQRRIVAKLDSLFARSRRAREELARVSGLCDRYKQAVLAAAFRGDLTADWREENQPYWDEKKQQELFKEATSNRNSLRGSRLAIGQTISEKVALGLLPTSWLYGRLIDIADIKTGYAFKSNSFQENGVRLVRGINISPGNIDWSETAYLSVELATEYEEYEIKEGDLLLAMDRPLISSGLKLARASTLDVPSILVQRVARIRPKQWTSASFIWSLLKSHVFVDHIILHSTGSDLPHIEPI
jgi:type I restriction enzyme S subunit